MKNNIQLLVLALAFFAIDVFGQQLPLVAQHPEYHGLINPASLNIDYLTDERNISFGTSLRQQWVHLGKLSPSTQVVRGECINNDYSFVAGGYIVHDRVGITNNLSANGRFAYVIQTGDDLTEGGISIGLNIGFANWRLRTDNLSLNQLDDPNLPNNPSSWYWDLGFGAYWYQKINNTPSHYFYMGLSVPRTFEFRNDYQGAKRLPHYYGLLGYYAPLFENSFIEASIWSRYIENVPLQTSFHLRGQLNSYILLGIGIVTDFKSPVLWTPELTLNIPNYNTNTTFKIGYSYTLGGSFYSYFGGTHEINLAFVLDNRR